VTTRLWVPRRVLITRSAAALPHTAQIVARCADAGVSNIEYLASDRITGLRGDDERTTYARAKSTLAVVVSAPSKRRRLQPIPPSADWRLDLAEGCPAHCQYCYLAGSLAGPPVTRVYADIDDILACMDAYVGAGSVTSGTAARGHEGTTFEASCYTDPLGIEHVTGSLSAAITHVGTHTFPGMTIAPIMPVDGWREEYGALLDAAAAELAGIAAVDLTVECITHRFTPTSKEVLTGWYPRTQLEMEPERRSRKRGKFGATKYVYPPERMRELRAWFAEELERRIPAARLLYWT
jgi:DNA repair photolyase